jgi:hypothetical protein
MIRNPNHTSIPSRLRTGFCPISLIAAVVLALAEVSSSFLNGQSSPDEGTPSCNYVPLLIERFDIVTPPALPPGWSSTTWVTSNELFVCSYPNAAFVDERTLNSDKRLLSPNIYLIQGGEDLWVSFCNDFNMQDGFDGGVLEVSLDNGLTFQDIIAAGGTFVSGGYTGTISSCCGNPLAGRQAWTGNSRGEVYTALTVRIPAANMMMLRWRMGTDSSIEGMGWRIDNIFVTQCEPTPTPVPVPSPRPRPTPAPRPSP